MSGDIGEHNEHAWVGDMSAAAYCSKCGRDYRDANRSWCNPEVRRHGHSALRAKEGRIEKFDPNPPEAWWDGLEAGISQVVRGLGDVCKALNRRREDL